MLPRVLLAVLVGTALCADKLSSLSTYWSAEDSKRISSTFENIAKTKTELSSIHYAVSGLRLLNVKLDASTSQTLCEKVKKVDATNLDDLFHAASIAGDLTALPCALTVVGVKEAVDAVAKEAGVTTEKLFDALTVADRFNVKANGADFDKAISAAIAKDGSAKSLANGLAAASLLDKALGAKYLEKSKTLVELADEVDGKYLQLDGGLSVTATAVYAIAQLEEQQGKSAPVTKEQWLLLSSYLLSRRQVFAERAAYNVIRAIGVLVNSKHAVPVSVSLAGAPDANKPIKVHVSNIYGLHLDGIRVKLDKLVLGDKIVDSNKQLTKVANDNTNTLFELNVADKATEAGFYTAHISVESADKRLIGTSGISFSLKQTQEVAVEGLKLTVEGKEGTTPETHSVAQFSKLGKALVADTHNRLTFAFSVKTKSGGKNISPHQAFITFEHVDTGAEAIFVADKQTDLSYELVVPISKSGEEFEGLNGKYRIRLTVGDALIRTPIDWVFADITLTVPSVPVDMTPKSEKIHYETLPAIEHKFREPEKRPPSVVSDFFTIACLVPLLVLFILWIRIGVNLSNMPASPFVLLFHGGLAALFGLYFVFWLRLNMFETLKYLTAIGGFTFIAGQRLLRLLADKRKMKTE